MVILNADHHFTIGHEHVTSGKPCQDHALSVFGEDMACAVVSDGCSTGGETDMGARVLTFATIVAVKAYYTRHKGVFTETGITAEVDTQQRIVLSTVRGALGLSRDDMLATCGYVFASKEGGVLHLVGDGVIALLYRDGSMRFYRYDWGKAPFYPQYREESCGAGYVHEHREQPESALTCEIWRYVRGSPLYQQESETAFSVEDGMRGVTHLITSYFIKNEIASIAVFTDGVLRVDNFDWKDVVNELMSFKTTKGQFVKRRLNAALKKFRTLGKGPMDDLAYGVVNVAEAPEQGVIDGNAN